MAFFDEMGKKLAQTGQNVAQKTKNTTETIKLNGLVSDEEKRINNTYLQIGKAYYENFSANPDPVFANFVQTIKDSKGKIASYQEQIRQMKGVRQCTNCGNEMPDASAFCSICGTALPAVDVQTNVQSGGYMGSQSGSPTTPQQDFHMNPAIPVYAPLNEPQQNSSASNFPQNTSAGNSPTTVQPSVPMPAQANNSPTTAGQTCEGCGSPLPADSAFCTNCGRKVD
jgi:hypothetical protein